MNILVLVLLVGSAACLPATQFGESSVKTIFQSKKDSLILFSGSDDEQSVRETFMSASKKDESGTFYTYLNKQKNQDHFIRFGEYLGIDIRKTPAILFVEQGAKKYLYSETDITEQAISQFIIKVKSGEAKRLFKSAPIPQQQNDGFVKILVANNFKDIVFGDEKQYLVKFYAPWCGHCKQMAPDFQAAAKAISQNPNIVLAKVDGSANEVQGVQITGYPTLWFFPKDKTQDPLLFNGGRDKQGIIDWLRDHTEYDWVELKEANEQL